MCQSGYITFGMMILFLPVLTDVELPRPCFALLPFDLCILPEESSVKISVLKKRCYRAIRHNPTNWFGIIRMVLAGITVLSLVCNKSLGLLEVQHWKI